MLEPQTLLAGRYRVSDVLAEGGMGIVYRAHDERLDRLVAIKTVRSDDPDLIVRMRREAQLLARLTHPNVVSLYDVGDHDGQPYLVTQFVDGTSLRHLLGRLTPRRIAWVAEQIAHALTAAHAVGIVHRDLKPSNVLVGDGTVRLLDFGIACQLDDTTLTTAEGILGTASYISPEQLRGQPAGPGADVYALGLVLIECFSGRAAFAGTFAETVAARLVERPELPGSVPGAWRSLVAAMTDPDPAARPPAPVVASAVRALGRARPPGAAAADAIPAGSDMARPPIPLRSPAPVPRAVAASGAASAEPPSPHGAFRRRAVVVPAAAAAGFLLVVAIGSVFAPAEPEQSVTPAAASSSEAAPAATLPLTEAPAAGPQVPEVLSATASAPTTTTIVPLVDVTVVLPPSPNSTVAPDPAEAPPSPPAAGAARPTGPENRVAKGLRDAAEKVKKAITRTTRTR
jgi:predicted Ser/Thr protein kinase